MKNSFTVILLLFLNLNCFSQKISPSLKNDEEKILEVIYNNGENESGYDELKISKDSISYIISTEQTNYHNNILNIHTNWINLIQAIDLEKFDKIKNGENRRATDGLDTHIKIITSKKEHLLIVDNDNYIQIKKLLTQLKLNLKKVYRKGRLEY